MMSIINLAHIHVLDDFCGILLSVLYTVFWRLINQVRGSIRLSQPSVNRELNMETQQDNDLACRVLSATVSEAVPTIPEV